MAIDSQQIDQVARILAVLGEPSRLRILSALMDKPLSVNQIIAATGLKQANVSKQLSILFDSGLVARQREGVSVQYRIALPLLYDLCGLVCEGAREIAARRLAAFVKSAHPVGQDDETVS